MNIRALIFWAKDFIFGCGKVRRNFDNVRSGFGQENENLAQLSKILEWASKEVPYYKGYSGKSLNEYPVVNKNIIKGGGAAFRSAYYLNSPLHEEVTSGSTGTPFAVVQDPGKRLRATADLLAFSERSNYEVGSRLYYVRIWNNLNRKNWLTAKASNIIMQSSDDLSDLSLSLFLHRLEKDRAKKTVLAYSSSLIALVNWMDREGRKTSAKVQSFITMSESMPSEYRRRLSELFHCPVFSRYSNQECGLIAQQCQSDDEYHINTNSFMLKYWMSRRMFLLLMVPSGVLL